MSIWRVKPVSAFEADMKKNDLKRAKFSKHNLLGLLLEYKIVVE